jgi:hypothetical protein
MSMGSIIGPTPLTHERADTPRHGAITRPRAHFLVCI